MTPAEFKTARSQLGLSLTGMAQLLRVNRSTIIRWEQGHVPIPGLAAFAAEMCVACPNTARDLQQNVPSGPSRAA